MTLHDRDGMPDPDPRYVPDTGNTYYYRRPDGTLTELVERSRLDTYSPDTDPLPRSGAILGYGCLALIGLVLVVVGVVR